MELNNPTILCTSVLRNTEAMENMLKHSLGEGACCTDGVLVKVCENCEARLTRGFTELLSGDSGEEDFSSLIDEGMYMAVFHGYHTMMKLLLPHYDVNQKVQNSNSHFFKYRGHVGLSLLQVCAINNDIQGCMILIKGGANIHVLDKDGCSLLHLISDKSSNVEKHLSMMDFLLELGLSLNQGDNEGDSPLHYFIKANEHTKNSCVVASHMIQKGCNINMVNKHSQSALHIAVIRMDCEMVAFLLMRGANVHIGESSFSAPVDIAREYAIASYTSNFNFSDMFELMLLLMSAGGMPSSCIYLKKNLTESSETENNVRARKALCNKAFLRVLLLIQNKSVLTRLKEYGYAFSEEFQFISDLYREENINVMTEERLWQLLNGPASLQDLTAGIVRRNLYPNAWVSVDKINLPATLRKIIADPQPHLSQSSAKKFKLLSYWTYGFSMCVLGRRLSQEQS